MLLIEHTPKRWTEYLRTHQPISESIVPLKRSGARDWKSLVDEAFIAHVNWRIESEGARTSRQLKSLDPALYSTLIRREGAKPGLIGKVRLKRRNRRDLRAMDDDALVRHAQEFMRERGIAAKMELAEKDNALYGALIKREMKSPGIMGKVGFERRQRDLRAMDDDALVRHAQEFMRERGIGRRSQLEREDTGLYLALLRREREKQGIMEKVGFEVGYMNWKAMDDNGIVSYAKRFIGENGIRNRTALASADIGLYHALLRRKKRSPGIMDAVFSAVESAGHADAVGSVLEALESFGGSNAAD